MTTHPASKPKVAILFSGLLRSIQYTLPNIQHNLFQELTSAGYDYDIYCHNYIFPAGQTYNNHRTKEYNVVLDPALSKHLNAKYYIEDDQIKTAAQLNLPAYRTKGDPWPTSKYASLDNYLLSMYSRKKITELLIEKHTQHPADHQYEYIIYARSDVIYEKPLPFAKLFSLIDTQPNPDLACLIPNFHHFQGLNDRMLICKPYLAKQYGLAFDLLLELSKHNLLHSESVNKYLLQDVYKATSILVPIYFSRVRSNGAIKRENFAIL